VIGLLPGGAAVLVSGRPQVTAGGLGADVAPDAANTIPLAAPRQATTDGEVSA
jgi:type IV secretory pathway TrbL component